MSQFFDLDIENPLGRGTLAKFELSVYVEKLRLPDAHSARHRLGHSDAGSGKGGIGFHLMLDCFLKKYRNIILSRRSKNELILMCFFFKMNALRRRALRGFS
jgi:hypothetical protein